MYHFFVEPFQIHEEQEYIEILGGDVNHIENVLRMKQGEELTVSDGFGSEYRCSAQEFSARDSKGKDSGEESGKFGAAFGDYLVPVSAQRG